MQDYALPINRVLPDLLTGSFLITVALQTFLIWNLILIFSLENNVNEKMDLISRVYLQM